MTETKPWWTSKTIVASGVGVVGVVLRLAGHELTAADEAALVDAIGTLVTLGGLLFAIYGRVTATTVIGKP